MSAYIPQDSAKEGTVKQRWSEEVLDDTDGDIGENDDEKLEQLERELRKEGG